MKLKKVHAENYWNIQHGLSLTLNMTYKATLLGCDSTFRNKLRVSLILPHTRQLDNNNVQAVANLVSYQHSNLDVALQAFQFAHCDLYLHCVHQFRM